MRERGRERGDAGEGVGKRERERDRLGQSEGEGEGVRERGRRRKREGKRKRERERECERASERDGACGAPIFITRAQPFHVLNRTQCRPPTDPLRTRFPTAAAPLSCTGPP